MPDLIAQSPDPRHRWRRRLETDHPVILGRSAGPWSIPWDPHISRQHVQVMWDGNQLKVEVLPQAANPVFVDGKEQYGFLLSLDQHFVIGSTTFTVSDPAVCPTEDLKRPISERTISRAELQQHLFVEAEQRMSVLTRIPSLLETSSDDATLAAHLTSLLMDGISRAASVGVIEVAADGETAEVVDWAQRNPTGDAFRPSLRLIQNCAREEQSILHIWEPNRPAALTQPDESNWAFCTPVQGGRSPWFLYVAGQTDFSPEVDPMQLLADDLKVAELIAHTVGNLRAACAWNDNTRKCARSFPKSCFTRCMTWTSCGLRCAKSRCCSVIYATSRGPRPNRPMICWAC